MNSRHFYSYIFFIIILLVQACKPTQDMQPSARASLPDSFIGSKDTVNTATLKWRDYFSDPNLVGLLDTCLKNNWDVLAAFQRIQMAQSDVLLNKGALMPAVEGGLMVSQRKFGLYTMDGAGNITTDIEQGNIVPTHLQDYYPGVYVSWEADVWGKLRNRKRAAVNRFLASVEGKNFVLTNLIAEVASGYYELIALDNELSILNETITLQENAFELIKVQKDAGVANELAVKQFEAQLLNSKGMRVEVRQRIIEAENQINMLSGRYPQTVARDSSAMNAVPAVVKTGLPNDLLLNRPDIRQAEFELAATHADVKAAKAAFYPSLYINGSIGLQAYKTSLLFSTPESYVYGLFGSLTGPLLNRSAIRSEFNSANARQMEALYNYQRTIANGYVEVYNLLTGIRNLEEVYTLKSRETDALTESIDTSAELFRTGRANYLEVIVTQQNALQARLELVDVRKRQFNATVSLYKALGGGWR
jgi:multidrug efflux system outer membrane protein